MSQLVRLVGKYSSQSTHCVTEGAHTQTIRDFFFRIVHSAECKSKEVAMQVREVKDEDMAYKATKIIFFLFSFHLRSKYLETNLFQSGVCLTSRSSRHCMIIINLYKYVPSV